MIKLQYDVDNDLSEIRYRLHQIQMWSNTLTQKQYLSETNLKRHDREVEELIMAITKMQSNVHLFAKICNVENSDIIEFAEQKAKE